LPTQFHYWLKFACYQLNPLVQVVLWCGFIGKICAVEAIAAPLPAVGDLQTRSISQVKAIVNSLPPQQLGVQGETDQQQQPINLDRWLVPIDDVFKLLEISQKELPGGELELTSPYLQVKLHPLQWKIDSQLGRSITIGELQKLPGVTISFDAQAIALKFSYTLPKNPPKAIATPPPKVSLDGLVSVNPPTANLSAVSERINLSGSASDRLNTQGEFKAVGTVLGSSWYLRVDQPQLANLLTWGLSEAVIINQTANTDWISGSQSPFWRRQGNPTGAYWGVTTIQRQDFTPPTSLSGGDFVPNERLQSSRLGRTVVGQAPPGTVVRLIKGFNTEVVGQVLVDSSGIFRFENVVVSKEDEFGSGYRLLLYPNGQLTTDPQVRDVAFTTVPGQLPVGSGAWIASLGANYNRKSTEFVGKLDGIQGGAAYRRGISESVTVGAGIIADPLALRALGEVFWQPTGIPLQASVSAVTGDRWDMVSSINYKPDSNFNANFSSDKLSSRADLNWQLTPKLTATSKYDSLSGVAIGGNYNFSLAPNSNSNIQGTLDSNSFLRWSANHQQENWRIGLQGNEISLNSEVSYQLPSAPSSTQNIVASYQSTSTANPTIFSQLLWRYNATGFQSELGYGWSGSGKGANAALGVTLAPGLQFIGRYQGISALTNQENFSLELQSTLDFQVGRAAATTRVEDLRTRGGIAIQPFFDRNSNGRQDLGEESYWHPNLIMLDKQPLNPSQTNKLADRIEIRSPPGSYRIDVNPAHLPPHWRSSMVSNQGQPLASLRVNVALGSYTNILIPLTPVYTVTGIVSDATGKPLPRVEVTAIDLNRSGNRRTTISKADGSYEFTDLNLGAYQLQTLGRSQPKNIVIISSSPVLQKVDLQQTDSSQQNSSTHIFTGNDQMMFINF
jgi:Carboxypeptidase regulatory-like domain